MMEPENLEDIMYGASEEQRQVLWPILGKKPSDDKMICTHVLTLYPRRNFYFILRRRIYHAKLGPSQHPIRFPGINVFLASTYLSEEV